MMKKHIEKRHNKPQSDLDFKIMSLCFSIRDKFKDPMKKLEKAGIKTGNYILDYGSGPGSYSIAAAKVVGSSGKIYAADIHPLAIKKVRKNAAKHSLTNIETILTDCNTGLEDNSIDVVICFDTLHTLGNLMENLKEFYRVLKPNGILSVDDHHSEEQDLLSKIQDNDLFKLLEKKEKIFNFIKINS
ncbi:MAG: class I SAM-dependent methyltransferase [Promethearchaeota archaeon]|nr:MAG: class I SAM-dependent methyltransferase [Candidatus Lokiarchaeota archaeon]